MKSCILVRFIAFTFLVSFVVAANSQIPAFPGAEGFGAYATGGRGGDVYHVINLNNSGAGSFADAIATAPSSGRTIVFDVSGYIHVNKTSLAKSKVTIAGQTAPGDGIGFKDGSFFINGNNIIIQHARFRYRDQAAGGDCIDIGNGVTNLMLDHISVEFSTDENLSSFEQNPRPDLVSFQWSLNAWGLESHSCGGLWDLERVTTHHTLWSHNHTRNPKARPYGLLDWINNVTFDWDIGFIMGDSTTPASWKANVRGSYFVCPPGNTHNRALEKASLDRNGNYNFTLHVSTNLLDYNGNSVLDGSDYGFGIASGSYQVSNSPIVVAGLQVPVAIDPPLTAYKKIVSAAGPLRMDALAGIPLRDEVDTILVSNLVALRRNHVSSESGTGASNGGMGYLNSAPPPIDTDRDGMPDFWENTLAWNAASDDHNTALPNSGGFITGLTFFPSNTVAGYTRLEEYLYFLTLPHATILRNTAGNPSSLSVDLRRYTSGFNKSPINFTFSNITNGTVVLQPDGYTAVFTPTLNFAGRARFDFIVTDGDGSTWRQTFAVLVSSAALPRDLKWKGGNSANQWNTSTLNWLDDSNTVVFANGDNVLFDDTGFNSPDINLTTALIPSSVEVNASQNFTFSGNGSISGAGSLSKSGSGTLTIGTTNSAMTGPIDLAGGTLSLSPGTTLGSGQMTLRGGATLELVTSGTVDPANAVTIPGDNFATITSGSLGNELSGAVTGESSSVLYIGGTVSFKQGPGQFNGFPGTVVIPPGELLRLSNISGTNGGVNTTFNVDGTLLMRNENSAGQLGALTGSGLLTGEKPAEGTLTFIVGSKNINTTFAGTIADKTSPTTNTALIKVGSGTLTLTGVNPHTGTTTVNGGTLLVNGTNSGSPTVVANGGTLGGAGRIGGLVTVNSGGKLAPGSSAGTLNLAGGLTLNSGTLNFELANVTTPGGGVNDLISMAGGTLTLIGNSVVNPSFLNGSLANGSYTLISGGSSTVGSAANLSWGSASGGRQTFSFNTSTPGTVQLVVGGSPAASLVWLGLVNNNWDMGTFNWTNGVAADRFYNLDSVLFDDTGLGQPNVNLTTAITPAAITVNSSGIYTFGGPGVITGPGTLTKSGAGTLNIVNSNGTFTGSVQLTGGTLALGVAGSTLGNGPLTISGGAVFNMPPSSIKYTYSGILTVPAGQSGTLYSPGFFNELFCPLVSGDSNSVLNITGDVSFGGTTSSQFDGFQGTINIQPGGKLRFSSPTSGNTFGSLNPTFIINGTLWPRNAGNSIRLGALSGSGSIAGPQSNDGSGDTTYIIGGNNLDVTFDGVISSNNAVPGTVVLLDKIGSGKLTLSGSSTFTGGTTVQDGSLIVNNVTGSATGTGDLSVAGGATLGGNGFIGSATTLDDFAILSPGNSAGMLTFNNDLDLGEFCLLDFELGTSSDSVAANSALTLQGTLNVIPVAGFGAGSYTLFTYNPANTFNYSGINIGSAPAGFNFEISTNTPGLVQLVVSPVMPPSFGGIQMQGGSLVVTGCCGMPGEMYSIYASTNIALPASNWSLVLTNVFDLNGGFSFTNVISTGPAQQFYRLQIP